MLNKEGSLMKEKILQTLEAAHGFVSGEEISQTLSVSRTAVWKAIQQLRSAGYPIESVKHHGYRLTGQADVLTPWTIGQALAMQGVHEFGRTIYHEAVVDSTNMAARRAADEGAPDLSLFIADEQTAGRGRRGRAWQSDHRQGLWFSLLLKPEATPSAMSRLTLFAGLCVTQAIRQLCEIDAAVKWPNDIVVLPSGRKLCGILTEMVLEENQITAVILGIGINVNTETFADDLTEKATSLWLETGHYYRRVDVLAAILRVFEQRYPEFLPVTASGIVLPGPDNRATAAVARAGLTADTQAGVTTAGITTPAQAGIKATTPVWAGSTATIPAWMHEYRQLCATLGRSVVLLDQDGQQRQGEAVDLTENGDLIVIMADGQRETVHAGEVSVRGLLGYS